jgi:hypothetical protein
MRRRAMSARVLTMVRVRMLVVGGMIMHGGHLLSVLVSHGHAKAGSHRREPLKGDGKCDCER